MNIDNRFDRDKYEPGILFDVENLLDDIKQETINNAKKQLE